MAANRNLCFTRQSIAPIETVWFIGVPKISRPHIRQTAAAEEFFLGARDFTTKAQLKLIISKLRAAVCG